MNKICTDILQSKKLIELGIDIKTADMYWWATSIRYYIEAIDDGDFNEEEGHIRAWSLTALMKLLPSDFTVKGELKTSTYQIKPRKYRLSAELEVYQIAYGNYGSSGSWHDMINTPECDNPLDAAFKMVVWLKENNKI